MGAWSIFFNKDSEKFMEKAYITPWVRITPYLMGITVAIWYYNYTEV